LYDNHRDLKNKIMTNLFIPYEQALALKELGFDEPCLGWYLPEIFDKGNIPSVILGSYLIKWNKFGDRLSAPLYQQAFTFFGEKYGYDVTVKKCTPSEYKFEIEKLFIEDEYYFNDFPFLSHKEAELECVKKLIEICKRIQLAG
jgi:hypothetical protein